MSYRSDPLPKEVVTGLRELPDTLTPLLLSFLGRCSHWSYSHRTCGRLGTMCSKCPKISCYAHMDICGECDFELCNKCTCFRDYVRKSRCRKCGSFLCDSCFAKRSDLLRQSSDEMTCCEDEVMPDEEQGTLWSEDHYVVCKRCRESKEIYKGCVRCSRLSCSTHSGGCAICETVRCGVCISWSSHILETLNNEDDENNGKDCCVPCLKTCKMCDLKWTRSTSSFEECITCKNDACCTVPCKKCKKHICTECRTGCEKCNECFCDECITKCDRFTTHEYSEKLCEQCLEKCSSCNTRNLCTSCSGRGFSKTRKLECDYCGRIVCNKCFEQCGCLPCMRYGRVFCSEHIRKCKICVGDQFYVGVGCSCMECGLPERKKRKIQMKITGHFR